MVDTDAMKFHMERETGGRKCCLALGSLFHMVFVAAIGTVWMFYWINMRDL